MDEYSSSTFPAFYPAHDATIQGGKKKRTMRRRSVLCFSLVIILLFSLLPAALAAPPADEPTPPAEKVVVTDALGRTTEFAAPPQRVVAAGKAVRLTVDTLYTLPEARQRVVALEGRSPSMMEFLSVVNPGIGQVQFLERDAGPEQIVATRPDAVILKSYLAEKLGKPIEQLGIPVIYVDLETPDQFLRDLVTLGQLFGSPARAEEVSAFYRTRMDRVSAAMAGLTDAARPSVLILQRAREGEQVAFSVAPAAWIQTTMAEMAGGMPVWTEAAPGGGWSVVGLEQIAAWNPDVICVVSYTDDPGAVVEALKADPAWQALKATQSGRLLAFPSDFAGYSWDQPDTRWILGLTWLAKVLHPDRFASVDMSLEVNDFFGQIYGLDQATIEASITPMLRGDVY
jgi:iron complex transport system substrate-binding protein